MLRDLRQVCERPGNAEPDDFRSAARAVLKRQFLLLERPGDRDSYRLIVNHFDYFANLFDALGWTLHRDDTFGLIGLLPGDAEGFRHLRLVDSLMLLCLRLLYEEGMERFEAREGSVYTQSQTLLGRYETLLGRKLPPVSDYREIAAPAAPLLADRDRGRDGGRPARSAHPAHGAARDRRPGPGAHRGLRGRHRGVPETPDEDAPNADETTEEDQDQGDPTP